MQFFFDVFHDVNSNLYTVTSIYHKVWILLKVISDFQNLKVTLFTVTSFHIFQKRTRNSKTWKPDGKRQEIKGSKKVNIHV